MRRTDWIPTLEKWKTGAELTKNDILFDENGNPNPIIELIHDRLPIKKVLLDDGTEIICHDKELLYVNNIRTNLHAIYNPSTISIKNYKDVKLKVTKDMTNAFCINQTKCLNYINQNLEYDPYILGCLIGNSQKDPKSEQTIIDLFGEYKIPEKYLTAKEGNRLKLLSGMMDTNGIFNKGFKNCEFRFKKPDLVQDFKTLCRSLGYPIKTKEFQGRRFNYSCFFNPMVNPFIESDEKYDFFYKNMKTQIRITAILEIGVDDVVIPVTKNSKYYQGKNIYLKGNEL